VGLTIEVQRNSQQVAPEGIRFVAGVSGFDATPPVAGVYDPTMHDIFYVWTFSDAGNYAAPQNMLAEWRNRDRAYGPFPSHVFTRPGLYTVTCTAYERASGKAASASVEITVKDPAVEYAGARTVCLAPDGNFAGAPAGHVPCTTWADAVTAYRALSQPGRLLVKGGSEVTVGSTVVGSAYRTFHLGSFGTGRAILRASGSTTMFSIYAADVASDAVVIENVEIRGGWDSTTETGDMPNGLRILGGGHVTVSGVHCDGCSVGIGTAAVGADMTLIVNECSATNWNGYGIYLSGGTGAHYAILGTRAAQHVQALQGGNGKRSSDPGNEHGPLRVQECASLYIDCFDAFSRNTWGTQGAHPPDQSCIRDHRNAVTSRGYFCRMVLEGGLQVFGNGSASPDRTGDGGFHQPCNTVMEMSYLLGTARSTGILGLTSPAFTGRNLVLYRPNVPTGAQKVGAAISIGVIESQHPDFAAAAVNEPVNLYNVTVVNDLDDINDEGVTAWQPWENRGPVVPVAVDNLVVHVPNNTKYGTEADGPLDTTAPGTIVPRYLGYRYRSHVSSPYPDQLEMLTQYATPTSPNPVALFRPRPGSPAIGAADAGRIAWSDLFGQPRGANPSRGATEPV
jgi:hypothetical protein